MEGRSLTSALASCFLKFNKRLYWRSLLLKLGLEKRSFSLYETILDCWILGPISRGYIVLSGDPLNEPTCETIIGNDCDFVKSYASLVFSACYEKPDGNEGIWVPVIFLGDLEKSVRVVCRTLPDILFRCLVFFNWFKFYKLFVGDRAFTVLFIICDRS